MDDTGGKRQQGGNNHNNNNSNNNNNKNNNNKKKKGKKAKERKNQRTKKEKDEEKRSAEVKYKASHRILVVGDGDFSFSRGLVAHLGGEGEKMIATSYDSFATVKKKYKGATKVIKGVSKSKATVVHGIDARALHEHFPKQKDFFHRVVWNFPHSGQQRVHINRDLLRQFLVSAPYVLHPNGQIHITIKDGPPYNGWNIPELATGLSLVHAGTLDFNQNSFPGYAHKTTLADAKEFDPQADGSNTRSKTLVFMKPSTYILQVEPSEQQLEEVNKIKAARKQKKEKRKSKKGKSRQKGEETDGASGGKTKAHAKSTNNKRNNTTTSNTLVTKRDVGEHGLKFSKRAMGPKSGNNNSTSRRVERVSSNPSHALRKQTMNGSRNYSGSTMRGFNDSSKTSIFKKNRSELREALMKSYKKKLKGKDSNSSKEEKILPNLQKKKKKSKQTPKSGSSAKRKPPTPSSIRKDQVKKPKV
eukprot:m.7250 g.7250  ORF g.7250 m.7250 type:complete len:472 (-) comp5689_c1_seq1:147-1562(-)